MSDPVLRLRILGELEFTDMTEADLSRRLGQPVLRELGSMQREKLVRAYRHEQVDGVIMWGLP